MKELLIIANWKSNKTTNEARDWLEEFRIQDVNLDNKKVIVCPPATLPSFLKDEIDKRNLPIKLGAQDVSPFGIGAYTGEINAAQLKEFTDYVIIGHSERRKNFHEDEEIIQRKIEQALKNNLTPILCISEMEQISSVRQARDKSQTSNFIIAYEPLFAIGSGNPDTPENASNISFKIKEALGDNIQVLYGGSITFQNVSSFTKMPNINGVFVGGGSLDALEFVNIIKNA